MIPGFFAQAMRRARPANAVPPAFGTCVQCATNKASSHWSSLSKRRSSCLAVVKWRMHATAARRMI